MKVVNRSLGTAVHGLSVCVWLAPCRLALRKMLMVLAWTHLSKCQRLLLKVCFSFQALSPAYAGLELQLQLMPGVHVARSAQLSLLTRQLSFHTPSSGGQHMAPHAACQQSRSMQTPASTSPIMEANAASWLRARDPGAAKLERGRACPSPPSNRSLSRSLGAWRSRNSLARPMWLDYQALVCNVSGLLRDKAPAENTWNA